MPFGSIEEGIASILVQQRDALQEEVTPVYVPLLGKHFASDEAEPFDLETSVRQFMGAENQRRVLVLYGDAGSGKSSFFQTLTLSLLAEYTPENPIPLFISLPTLRDPVHRAVEETLENYGFSAEQIEGLKERHSFVFIFDGYDEIHQLKNLYMSNRLNTWQAKLLISCRSQYVYNKGNPDIYFMPLVGERGQPHLLSTLYTAAFNETQITTYFALMRERGVAIPSDEELQIIPGLKSLITTPFLLHMTVGVLPAILARYSAASSSDEGRRLKQMELYDAFITQWFLRQEEKLKLSGHITDDMPDKKPTFWRYAQALAVEMHKYDVTWVFPGDERFAVFFESEAETEMIRSACPLKKSGESFGFWHQSLGMYFTVRTMYEEECVHATELTAAEPAVMGAGVGAGSGTSDSSVSVPPPIGSIHHRLMTDDFSALKLLTDQIDARVKTRLFDIIDASKVDERYAIGAANAITILNWAGVMLIRKNWRGIQIPGANLSYAILVGSDLCRANLSGVRLFRANLQDVDLSEANLTNVDLGERDPIRISNLSPEEVAYHPSKPIMAILAGGLRIVQYDLERGVLLGSMSRRNEPSELTSVAEEDSHVPRFILSCFAYSPDGQYLAAGSWDNTVHQWDANTGAHFGPVLHGPGDRIDSVAYSTDGRLLACASGRTVRQWEVGTGSIFGLDLQGHTDRIKAVTYSADGRLLASGSVDKTVRQWLVCTGEVFGPVLEHPEEVHCIAYSPDSKLLASGDATEFENLHVIPAGVVRQWVVETGVSYGPALVGHKEKITCVTYSPDGKYLASSSRDKTVRQWDVENGLSIEVILPGEGKDVSSIAYSPDGAYLASSAGKIYQRNLKSNNQFPMLAGHIGWVYSVAFSPNGKYFASGSRDTTIRQWRASTWEPFGSALVGLTAGVTSIAYSPDGKHLASGGFVARQWNVNTGVLTGPFEVRGADYVAYSPDARLLATGGRVRPVRQWDVASELPFGSVINEEAIGVHYIAYSPDGKLLATVESRGHAICQWQVSTGQLFGPVLVSDSYSSLDSLAYSPDGNYLAAAGTCGVEQWKVETGERFGSRLEGHRSSVSNVAYTPCGKYLASAGYDGTIRFWIVETGAAHGEILKQGHTDSIRSIAFSPKGDYLVSGGCDNRVCLWKLDSFFHGELVWMSRSASQSLVNVGVTLHGVTGLSSNQLALLGAGSELTGIYDLHMGIYSPRTRERLLPNVYQVKSYLNEALFLTETQWYVHLVAVNSNDYSTFFLFIEGVLFPTLPCPNITRDIQFRISEGGLPALASTGSRVYLHFSSKFHVLGETKVNSTEQQKKLNFEGNLPTIVNSYSITPYQADTLMRLLHEDFVIQVQEIQASITTPLVTHTSELQKSKASYAWVMMKLDQMGKETNDERFILEEINNSTNPCLTLIMYGGLKISAVVLGAVILDARGYDSYQKLHQVLGVKIAATSVGFDAVFGMIAFCLLKGNSSSKIHFPALRILFLALIVFQISIVLSAVIFEKSLIGHSSASLFLGGVLVMIGLFLLHAMKTFGDQKSANDLAEEEITRNIPPGFFHSRYQLPLNAQSSDSEALIAEEGGVHHAPVQAGATDTSHLNQEIVVLRLAQQSRRPVCRQ